jgi:hypothetical protein
LVYPAGFYERVEVEMPAFPFVGYFDSVESSDPVTCKLESPEFGEPSPEFLDVQGGQVRNVLDGQDDVLGLLAFLCPPADLFLPLALEVGSAFRAVEAVAAIGEFADCSTIPTLGHGVEGVAILKTIGLLGVSLQSEFGGYGVFVNGCLAPKVLLTPFDWALG